MLKSTGIVRRIDDLGRVVIPIELRRSLELGIGDSVEIFTDNDKIVFRKYEPGCIICGSPDDLNHVRGKLICVNCATQAVKAI